MKNNTLRALSTATLAVVAIGTSYTVSTIANAKKAVTASPTVSIVGNPIGRKDSYTVNSQKEMSIKLNCTFINTGKTLANLNIWIRPDELKPKEMITLKAGTNRKPFKLVKEISLNLRPHWWCRIYTPHGQIEKWGFCAYFSVSDVTITEYNPFATWNKTIQSKDTSYQCRIDRPSGKVGFFYFK